jgi:branched-chain amino acid transport system substrate-binding protein
MTRLLASLWTLCSAALLTAACGGESGPGPLKVGVILPMTGGHADFGVEAWNAMQIALEDLKARSVPKVPWELILKDEQSKPGEGTTQAKTLINTAGVHVIVGSVTSGITRKVFQECKEAGVPGISPGATNDQITVDGGPFCSRICFKDGVQGPVLARFALSQGWKKVAVAEDKAAPYATGLSESFRKAFSDGGGTIAREYYQGGDADFSNLIQNVATANADVIFIAGYYGDAGLMLKQAQGSWGTTPVIGGDGFDGEGLIELAGSVKNPIMFTTHFAADDPNPMVQSFTKRYRERFGKAPGAMAAVGHDALLVLADAIDRCADPRDHEQLAKAIAATKGVKGVTGEMSLDNPERTPRKAVVVVRVDGGFKFVKSIPPE